MYRKKGLLQTKAGLIAMTVENLQFAYDGEPILRGVSFTIKRGAVTALIGANAGGKTTLLRLMTKNLTPDGGMISLDGIPLDKLTRRAFAEKAAVVHQKNDAPDDLTVEALVAYGRTPRLKPFRRQTQKDRDCIAWAMRVTDTAQLRCRPLGELSGGQRQRAFIAMALAQDTEILFLDEPTTFLDVRYQVELLRLIRALNKLHGLTIVMVLHDVNQALLYSDEILALRRGELLAQGAAREVITREMLQQLYGVDLEVRAENGYTWVLPIPATDGTA
jgi:iron complex transport system ATP-binding protein